MAGHIYGWTNIWLDKYMAGHIYGWTHIWLDTYAVAAAGKNVSTQQFRLKSRDVTVHKQILAFEHKLSRASGSRVKKATRFQAIKCEVARSSSRPC